MKASKRQVGGSHYKCFKIQPTEFIIKNNLGFLEGNVVKYACRHEIKGGEQDIDKAIHYLQLIKEYKYEASNKRQPDTSSRRRSRRTKSRLTPR